VNKTKKVHLQHQSVFWEMSNQYFDFKRFRIEQDRCSMKVGTDGVLLGAWFPLEEGMKVLDIGTGTGLVAIMAAQRGAGSVTAVEIDPDAAGQAAENAANSPWGGLISVKCTDISDFTANLGFDRIVCNPPFFRDSLRCPDEGRNTARHNDSLSFETLTERSADMLADDGLLCVVLPYDAVDVFCKCALKEGLNLCQKTDVITAPGKSPKRSLLKSDVICMCNSDGKESLEYAELVKEFYLKF
jgi:tRNA1Val (adenine37-N6)-methyltransferase